MSEAEAETIEPGLDVTVLLAVLEAGDSDARMALTRQIAAHLADTATPNLEREQIAPVLLKLAADEDREVRLVLNEELVSIETLPADVLFAVIADEDDLALPFLSVTPALSKAHMLAILRVGDEARQIAVAGRADLTQEAKTYILKNSPPLIVAEMLRNPTLSFTVDEYRTVYARLPNAAPVIETLLEQPNLPPDIRITEARRTAGRMRQLMAERGWIAANDGGEAIADAEETTILRIIIDAPEDILADTMEFLSSKNLLTPALLLRAAAVGEIGVIEGVIAHLAGYSLERTREFLFRRGASGVRSLLNKAGLPVVCLGIVQAACDVTREAATEGLLPMSQEAFGRRLLEALMTRYEYLSASERNRQIEYVGRYAEDRVRKIANRLRVDLQRAA